MKSQQAINKKSAAPSVRRTVVGVNVNSATFQRTVQRNGIANVRGYRTITSSGVRLSFSVSVARPVVVHQHPAQRTCVFVAVAAQQQRDEVARVRAAHRAHVQAQAQAIINHRNQSARNIQQRIAALTRRSLDWFSHPGAAAELNDYVNHLAATQAASSTAPPSGSGAAAAAAPAAALVVRAAITANATSVSRNGLIPAAGVLHMARQQQAQAQALAQGTTIPNNIEPITVDRVVVHRGRRFRLIVSGHWVRDNVLAAGGNPGPGPEASIAVAVIPQVPTPHSASSDATATPTMNVQQQQNQSSS